MAQHTFQIQLDGLIKLLAQNLYADPDVFLREMLQNAHDSIQRRKELAQQGEGKAEPGRIRIDVDVPARTIAIVDKGSGLTEAEAHDFLSTIGRSGTQELRDRLRDGDRGRTIGMTWALGSDGLRGACWACAGSLASSVVLAASPTWSPSTCTTSTWATLATRWALTSAAWRSRTYWDLHCWPAGSGSTRIRAVRGRLKHSPGPTRSSCMPPGTASTARAGPWRAAFVW